MLFGKDGANSVIIHRIAYFLGIRLILSDPQVIVVSAYIPYFFTYSWERVLDMTHSPLLVPLYCHYSTYYPQVQHRSGDDRCRHQERCFVSVKSLNEKRWLHRIVKKIPGPIFHSQSRMADSHERMAVEPWDGEYPSEVSESYLPLTDSNVAVGSDGGGRILWIVEPPSPIKDGESMDEFEISKLWSGHEEAPCVPDQSCGSQDAPGGSCGGRCRSHRHTTHFLRPNSPL